MSLLQLIVEVHPSEEPALLLEIEMRHSEFSSWFFCFWGKMLADFSQFQFLIGNLSVNKDYLRYSLFSFFRLRAEILWERKDWNHLFHNVDIFTCLQCLKLAISSHITTATAKAAVSKCIFVENRVPYFNSANIFQKPQKDKEHFCCTLSCLLVIS